MGACFSAYLIGYSDRKGPNLQKKIGEVPPITSQSQRNLGIKAKYFRINLLKKMIPIFSKNHQIQNSWMKR